MLGGVVEVVGSNLARGKIFTASIGSVDSIYNPPYCIICYMQNWDDTQHRLISSHENGK